MEQKTITHKFGLDHGYSILDTSSIDFPVGNNIFGQRKQLNVRLEFFRITFGSVSQYLMIDQESLLRLKFLGSNSKEGRNIKDVHLTTYETPYQILINHDAILDCTDLSQTNGVLKFFVEMSICDTVKKKEYIVTINLAKAKPNGNVDFTPVSNLKYVHDNICIGHLRVANLCRYRCADQAAVGITLKYHLDFNEDIVSLGQKKEIEESNPYYEVLPGLMSDSDQLESCLVKNRISNQVIEFRKITAQNTVSIPVYLDLNRLENPEESERIEKFVVSVKNILDDDIEVKEFSVAISRDFTKTRLRVSCNGILLKEQTKEQCGHFNWIHHFTGRQERFRGVAELVNISIGNEATNQGKSKESAVILKNTSIKKCYNREEVMSSDDFLETNELNNGIIKLKNGVNSEITYKCSLIHKFIDDIPQNLTKVLFEIDFDYVEDEMGIFDESKAEWAHFHAIAMIELEKDPGSEWLCVDYGTSATVATFGDGTERNTQILKLNSRNKEVLEEIENEKFRAPQFEEGETFLSSNIMLRPNTPSINSENINDSLVYLSPSEPRFHSKGFRLPYMKALAGYKDIPNGNLYSTFKYKINPTDTPVLSFGENPLEVDSIFRSTYRSLFKDYIVKCMPEGKEVNKIILTIPNTYTPHHIEYLRRIVKQEIKTLRSDYIWFVSESDAIAYCYLKNWIDFNAKCSNDYIDNVEHVLVYDMGAGTLDLTYLTIEHLKSGDKNVKMVSKMGLNKAGNYLDYILAEVLTKVYPDKFPPEILSHTEDDTMQNLLGKLKYFIKTTLKPKLFEKESITFSEWKGQTVNKIDFGDEILDLNIIRNHEKIQSYISECTDQLFDRFTEIGGLHEDESPIDTLIMTGRSIQFGDIKKRLQQRINSWNDDTHCYSLEIEKEELKTIVSKGALYYAALYGKRNSSVKLQNKNIYAKYGILYVNRQNKLQYQPLIDSETKPTGKVIGNTAQQNRMQIYTYDTDRFSADDSTDDIVLDMRNTIEAYLVQCYSSDPAGDYGDNERRNDYISIMVAFNPESVAQDTRNVHVRLVVDEKNEMIFTAGFLTFEASAPVKIDIEANSTFKHSMWPYI